MALLSGFGLIGLDDRDGNIGLPGCMGGMGGMMKRFGPWLIGDASDGEDSGWFLYSDSVGCWTSVRSCPRARVVVPKLCVC